VLRGDGESQRGNALKNLLNVTALVEGATGLVLVVLPSLLVTRLLGVSLEAPAATLARVAGVALLALAVACGFARLEDGRSRAVRGLVGAALLYNAGVAVVLAHAGVGQALAGIALWPTVLLHAAMAVWCVVRLSSPRK
jgi:hypothetical protein